MVAAQQFGVQRAQLGTGVGAQRVGEGGTYLLVAGQRLGAPPGVTQGAQPQGLQRLVEGVFGGEFAERGQRGACPAQGDLRGEPGAAGVEPPGPGPDGPCSPAVGQVGEGGAVPQGERVVEQGGGLGGVPVGEGADALIGQPLEAVQVDVVPAGREPVAAVDGVHRLVAEYPTQSSDQGLEGGGLVGGRVAVPHLGDQLPRPHGPPGVQREGGQQGPQPGAGDGRGDAALGECLRGPQNAVAIAHPFIVPGRMGDGAAEYGRHPDVFRHGGPLPSPYGHDLSRRRLPRAPPRQSRLPGGCWRSRRSPGGPRGQGCTG